MVSPPPGTSEKNVARSRVGKPQTIVLGNTFHFGNQRYFLTYQNCITSCLDAFFLSSRFLQLDTYLSWRQRHLLSVRIFPAKRNSMVAIEQLGSLCVKNVCKVPAEKQLRTPPWASGDVLTGTALQGRSDKGLWSIFAKQQGTRM